MTYSIFIRDVTSKKEELYENYTTGLRHLLFVRVSEIETRYENMLFEVVIRLADGTQVFNT